jgi:hypothetical protein
MIINLNQSPYFANPNKEYFEKYYRKIISLPSRVLQSREITNLSFFPMMAIKEFTDIYHYNTKIIKGLNNILDKKINENSYILNSINDTIELFEGNFDD